MPLLTINAIGASVTFADPYPAEGAWTAYIELGGHIHKNISNDQLERITPALVAQAALNHITWSVADVPGDPSDAITAAMLSSTANALGASLVGVEDAAGKITGTTVETALAEIALYKSQLALTTNGNGASKIGVEDSATKYTGTNVETCLAEVKLLADAVCHVTATPAAEVTGTIDVACQIVNAVNVAQSVTTPVLITVFPSTLAQGGVSGATAAVGSLVAATAASGPKLAWMIPAAGAFSFKVTDDIAEDVLVVINANGCVAKTFTLTFAGNGS